MLLFQADDPSSPKLVRQADVPFTYNLIYFTNPRRKEANEFVFPPGINQCCLSRIRQDLLYIILSDPDLAKHFRILVPFEK